MQREVSSMKSERTKSGWLTRLTEYLHSLHPRPWHGAILCDLSGMTRTITYEDDGSSIKVSVPWSDVVSVSAFKRDIYTYDLICIALETAEGCLEVNEDMEGWGAMVDALPEHLPGTPDNTEWWEKVALPPFVTNWTTLFTRA
jgi:hypothetical protein